MMLKKILLVLMAGLISVSFAQNKAGTTVAQFLKIGVGSRANGMGEAFVALSDDASGLFWNPAGISRAGATEFMFVHTQWIADIGFDYVGVIVPMSGIGTVGASITSLTMADMPVRTETQPNGTGEKFSASDMAMQISLARNLTDRFSIGFNAKFIQQSIWHMSAKGMAVDVGTLFKTQFHDMRLGMSISNFGTSMQMTGRDALVTYDPDPEAEGNNPLIPAYLAMDESALPLMFRVGVAMDVWSQGSSKLTVAVDALHPNDNYESLNIGTELNIANLVFLRGGWKSPFVETNTASSTENWERREEGFTVGAGVDIPLMGSSGLKFDYSFADFGRLKNAQRFTLNLYF
ncbi:MAG: PorV/PorQ family protein [Candidatus Marinimicrobia bacterium]|nr:PorV/PorQ family protein [Candidatus Neomarinimicrobiota bacterium]MCF7840017.1 PorV/PorQ family protein [Candidatus Neomarinimicrobiota bacterium]